jgi:hypothetical protein
MTKGQDLPGTPGALPPGVRAVPTRKVVERPGDDVREYDLVRGVRLAVTPEKKRELLLALPRTEVQGHSDSWGNQVPKEWLVQNSRDLGDGYRLARADGKDYLVGPDGRLYLLGHGAAAAAVDGFLESVRRGLAGRAVSGGPSDGRDGR